MLNYLKVIIDRLEIKFVLLANFPNFVYICATRGKSYHFSAEIAAKMVILRCYIFHNFQNFFSNFTNIKILFLDEVK